MSTNFLDIEELGERASQLAGRWSYIIYSDRNDGTLLYSEMEREIERDNKIEHLKEKFYMAGVLENSHIQVHGILMKEILDCCLLTKNPELSIRLFEAIPESTIERQFARLVGGRNGDQKSEVPKYEIIQEINNKIKHEYNPTKGSRAKKMGRDILNMFKDLLFSEEDLCGLIKETLNYHTDLIPKMEAQTRDITDRKAKDLSAPKDTKKNKM